MAFSTLKLVKCPLPPTPGANESHVQGPTILTVKNALLPLQVRTKEEQEQEAPKAFPIVSRRDMLLCLAAASLSGITVFSTKPVEAHVGKLESKRKVREKLEMLREKAGVSKPKSENKEKAAPRQPFAKEKLQMPLPQLSPSFPSSERNPVERWVETTLP